MNDKKLRIVINIIQQKNSLPAPLFRVSIIVLQIGILDLGGVGW